MLKNKNIISMTIFISIASYQDPLLLETICSAYVNAKHRGNLRFGVCEQADNGTDIASLDFFDQIEYELLNPVLAKGPCWARERIQHFYNNEDYYLQIDSHTIFAKDWDEILLKYYDWIKGSGIEQLVLTGYPRNFKPNESLDSFDLDTKFRDTLGITFREGRLFEDSHFSMQKSFPANTDLPAKGLLIAAGFIFTSREFVQEIPYDPKFYFHGEELSVALRLFTNNWSVVHIPRIPLFHMYTDVKNLPRKLHWDPDDDKNRAIKWNQLDKESKRRLTKLIYDEIDGLFGLGKQKTVDEFSEQCGLDLKNKKVIDLNVATKDFPFEVIEREDVPFKDIFADNQ